MRDFVNYYTTLGDVVLRRAFGKDTLVGDVRYYLYSDGSLQGETVPTSRGGELKFCLDDDIGEVAYLGVKMTATQGTKIYIEEFWVLSAAEAEKAFENNAFGFLFRCWREGCTEREDTLIRKGKGVVERTLVANYKLVRVRADMNNKVLFDLRKRSLEWDYTPIFKDGVLVGFGVKDAFKLFGEMGDGVWLRGALYEYGGQTIYKFFQFEVVDDLSVDPGSFGTFWFYVEKIQNN